MSYWLMLFDLLCPALMFSTSCVFLEELEPEVWSEVSMHSGVEGEDPCLGGVCDFYCTCNISAAHCDPTDGGGCPCDPDCPDSLCNHNGYCERGCALVPSCEPGCSCDRLFGLCNTTSPGADASCPCDIDCLGGPACLADAFCDRDCPADPDCDDQTAAGSAEYQSEGAGGTDPDCADPCPSDSACPHQLPAEGSDYRGYCECDWLAAVCEPARNGTGDVCACDPDC